MVAWHVPWSHGWSCDITVMTMMKIISILFTTLIIELIFTPVVYTAHLPEKCQYINVYVCLTPHTKMEKDTIAKQLKMVAEYKGLFQTQEETEEIEEKYQNDRRKNGLPTTHEDKEGNNDDQGDSVVASTPAPGFGADDVVVNIEYKIERPPSGTPNESANVILDGDESETLPVDVNIREEKSGNKGRALGKNNTGNARIGGQGTGLALGRGKRSIHSRYHDMDTCCPSIIHRYHNETVTNMDGKEFVVIHFPKLGYYQYITHGFCAGYDEFCWGKCVQETTLQYVLVWGDDSPMFEPIVIPTYCSCKNIWMG